jgi:Raf kinase inhibitor-like YbhB/YbcL family protein
MDSGSPTDAGADVMAGPFTLTSNTLQEGAVMPKQFSCNGANGSPSLTWNNPPAGTESFGVLLTDKTNGLIHWALYDVAKTESGLPETIETKRTPAIPAGSRQTNSYDPTVIGYLGPCPPTGEHIYEFSVYALKVAKLPGGVDSLTKEKAKAEMVKQSLGLAKLTVRYTKVR